jgi:tripartite-type tricarboxylate transporter receptor subunit TctC
MATFAPSLRRAMWRHLRCIAIISISLGSAHAFAADTFPSHPIKIVVGYPPGGSNDIIARIIAPPLSLALGESVIVENRAGASGIIGADYVAKAAPDGYTLLGSSVSPIIITPQTMAKAPFDTLHDFVAINTVGLTPEAIALGPNLKVTTLKELLALARTRRITLASSGIGGLPHLTIELLRKIVGDNITHVPYKGAGPAVSDTLAGHVDGIVMDLPPLYSLIKENRLRGLAVTSAQRVSFLPDLPTAQEELPNFNVVNWMGIFAPAKTPAAVVNKINDALKKVVADKNVQKQLANVAVVTSIQASPAAFQKFVGDEYARWGAVVKEAGIRTTE